MSLPYPNIETLAELLKEKDVPNVTDVCYVVRDWLAVRSALAYELGGGHAADVLDKAAVAAVR